MFVNSWQGRHASRRMGGSVPFAIHGHNPTCRCEPTLEAVKTTFEPAEFDPSREYCVRAWPRHAEQPCDIANVHRIGRPSQLNHQIVFVRCDRDAPRHLTFRIEINPSQTPGPWSIDPARRQSPPATRSDAKPNRVPTARTQQTRPTASRASRSADLQRPPA